MHLAFRSLLLGVAVAALVLGLLAQFGWQLSTALSGGLGAALPVVGIYATIASRAETTGDPQRD